MVDQHVASGAGARSPPSASRCTWPTSSVSSRWTGRPGGIAAFGEKPSSTPGLAAAPDEFLASMGNYVFDADALVDALHATPSAGTPSTTWAATSFPTS